MPKNLAMFEKIAAKTLAECFDSFPVACTFNAINFCNKDDNSCERVVYYTFKWLEDNGYIKTGKRELGKWADIHHVELTEKGLRVLHKKVKVLGFEGKVGALMSKASKAGGESLVSEAVKVLFALGSRIYL